MKKNIILETTTGGYNPWVRSRRHFGSNAFKDFIRKEAKKPYRDQRHYRIKENGKIYAVTWNFLDENIGLVEVLGD